MNETERKTNQTPYSAWLQTEILHTLQQTVSDHPAEYAFLINAQVQELYWALIVKEMQAAQACLREDNLVEAQEALLRVVDHHEPLNATWRSLSWITTVRLAPDFGGGPSYIRSRHRSSGMDLSAHGLPARHQARTAPGAF
jgi:tryptophan 2,3-dioxygenase